MQSEIRTFPFGTLNQWDEEAYLHHWLKAELVLHSPGDIANELAKQATTYIVGTPNCPTNFDHCVVLDCLLKPMVLDVVKRVAGDNEPGSYLHPLLQGIRVAERCQSSIPDRYTEWADDQVIESEFPED